MILHAACKCSSRTVHVSGGPGCGAAALCCMFASFCLVVLPLVVTALVLRFHTFGDSQYNMLQGETRMLPGTASTFVEAVSISGGSSASLYSFSSAPTLSAKNNFTLQSYNISQTDYPEWDYFYLNTGSVVKAKVSANGRIRLFTFKHPFLFLFLLKSMSFFFSQEDR